MKYRSATVERFTEISERYLNVITSADIAFRIQFFYYLLPRGNR